MAVKRSSHAKSTSSSRSTHAKGAANAGATRRPVAPRASTPGKSAAKAPRKVGVVKAAHGAPKPAKASKTRTPPSLAQVVLDALADMKAMDVKAMDVRGITDITDTMVVASGTSDRHVKSIADRVLQRCKEAGYRPYGMEGERDGEWVLLDLQDVVLHVMLPRVREFYALEKLWEGSAARRA
jgi:ribosome-associated protein